MYLSPLFFCVIVTRATDVFADVFTGYSVCETDACHEIGQAIQHGIDPSSDPCDNFYNYACGSWATNNPIPPSELHWETDDLHIMKINHQVKEILEEQSEYDELEPIKKLKLYYQACMDEDTIERQGLDPIMNMIDANGGWPIIMDSEDSKLDKLTWQEIDNTYNQMFSGNSFFHINYVPSRKNSSQNMLSISIDEDSFMEDELYEEDESSEEADLVKMIKTIQTFMKFKNGRTYKKNFDKEIEELDIFRDKFKYITERANQEILKGLEANSTEMTISELQEYYDLAGTQNVTSKINWLETIQFIYKNIDASIDASEPVIVYNKELLHELAELLDVTSPHVLVNFIQWNIVNEFTPYLNKEMRHIDFESKYAKYNVTKQEPRWVTCVEDIELVDAISYLYTSKYNVSHNIRAATEMTEEIKAEMKEHIMQSKWIDDSTKEFMLAKMDNLILQIGYPEWYNDQTELIKRYEGLLVGENYFKNFLSILMYETKKRRMDFRKPVNKRAWIFPPLEKNSFYDPTTNGLLLPIAEILDPYFTPGMPLAVNYGGVGMIIGHELAHSFDSDGIHYDKFGNRCECLSKETNEAYDERVKCFVDQYNDFTITDEYEDEEPIKVNGLLTKSENFADNVGLAVAFAAFQKRLLTTGPEPKLPNLTNVTDEQLFFLSFLNAWCMTSRDYYEENNANIDDHAFPRFRTIGSTANMVDFSSAFNCPANSLMNRELKCNLWI